MSEPQVIKIGEPWQRWLLLVDGFWVEIAKQIKNPNVPPGLTRSLYCGDHAWWGATIRIRSDQIAEEDKAEIVLEPVGRDEKHVWYNIPYESRLRLPKIHHYTKEGGADGAAITVCLNWDYEHSGWIEPRDPDEVLADIRQAIALLVERFPNLKMLSFWDGLPYPRADLVETKNGFVTKARMAEREAEMAADALKSAQGG